MTLTLALLGCGGMGRRHLAGLHKLHAAGLLQSDLVAVCDVSPEAGQRAADLAETYLGRRPAVYATFAELYHHLPSLDALMVTTPPDTHAHIAVEALHAGVHVMVEKPMALTVRQGLAMVQAASETGRVLAVAENYRRDPINRLAKALIDADAIDRPFLLVQSSSSGSDRILQTPWRHMRRHGGILIDMGVHYTDLLEYFLGPMDSVMGMSAQIDPQRCDDQGQWHTVDAEDISVGIGRFRNGALAHWLLNQAGRGDRQFSRIVYGTNGSLSIPRDRSGLPLRLVQHGVDTPLTDDELLALVPDFSLDAKTATLFGGERLARYDLTFADIDANLLGVEHDNFANAILTGQPPEVTGMAGLRALALMYGFLEAERLGRFVTADELLRGDAYHYQAELE